MNSRGKKVALAVALAAGKAIFGTLRFTLYVVLLLVGRVLEPLASLAAGVGLLIFLFCLIVRRDQVTPMWAGAALAFGATAIHVFYIALLRMVAPEGTVIVSDV